MSPLARLASGVIARPRAVLAAGAAVLATAVLFGSDVDEHLTTSGFQDHGSESAATADLLARDFGAGAPNVVLLATATDSDVDSPAVAAAGRELTARLAAEPDLRGVASYWSEGNAPPLRSDDGRRALIVGHIDAEEDVLKERVVELRRDYEVHDPAAPLTIDLGGVAEVRRELAATSEEDLVRAELLAVPITLVLLFLVFGSVVAGLLPLFVGVLSITVTMLVLRVLTIATPVSVFGMNLTTALGLGLAIDYSLLVISRHREELALGRTPTEAVVRAVETAGRTVVFSGAIVAGSLAVMAVFPLIFLRSFAYAGIAVTTAAVMSAVTVLPAMLALLGPRLERGRIPRRLRRRPRHMQAGERAGESDIWHRVAVAVMRRPAAVAVAVVSLLVVVGAPFLGLRLTQADDRVLPEGSPVRHVGDTIRAEFDGVEAGAITVIVNEDRPLDDAELSRYAAELASLPAVSRVDAATGTYCGAGLAEEFGCRIGDVVRQPTSSPRYATFRNSAGHVHLWVVPDVDPFSPAAEDLVTAIRSGAGGHEAAVTGATATNLDTRNALASRLPIAAGLIVGVTAVVLFLMFGSVVLPIKALALGALSLTASFGAMVWVFQEGNLADLVGITPTGGIEPSAPILLFCVAFGLSMDYEVFLLARISEQHAAGAADADAVAIGLARTGRIVTAAAVLISAVFVCFATSQVAIVKLIGLGIALAVLLDAFVIRGTLLPASMRLLGRWNWWAPRPLARLHARWGFSAEAPEGPPGPTTTPHAPVEWEPAVTTPPHQAAPVDSWKGPGHR